MTLRLCLFLCLSKPPHPTPRPDVSALFMGSEVFETPATLRKMLSTKPYKPSVHDLPGCCGDGRTAQITNWSSFSGDLPEPEGCKLVLHLPILPGVMWDNAIPFVASKGRKGIMTWTLNADEEGVRKGMPVGECVDDVLFP